MDRKGARDGHKHRDAGVPVVNRRSSSGRRSAGRLHSHEVYCKGSFMQAVKETMSSLGCSYDT